ncbi:MAG: prepilin-type N-terminal cleavage/methylation domain-containing protein [Nitrosomonadales bacterium]|nr:prepilin-type N-terminal cleavage/methylation domain-containing protein [Nitrosomonadales bacterium]
MNKRHNSGFTLIEIAIVLVVIGLLLGGVLKGQELISSAKVKNIATDFKNVPVFIYGYQDKFKTLPGDDASAATHLAGGTRATSSGQAQGNGLIEGNWNSTTATDESYLFWQHIRLAELTAGSTDTAAAGYLPLNAMGGTLGIQSGSAVAANVPVFADAAKTQPIKGSYVICSSGIPGKYAKQLDMQMDDGNTAGGAMLATPTTGYAMAAVATATASVDDATSYTVCMGV